MLSSKWNHVKRNSFIPLILGIIGGFCSYFLIRFSKNFAFFSLFLSGIVLFILVSILSFLQDQQANEKMGKTLFNALIRSLRMIGIFCLAFLFGFSLGFLGGW